MRVALALAAALLAGAAHPASPHSLLLQSSPAAGAVLARSPDRVVLTFNNRVEKPLSMVRLVDAAGAAQELAVVVAEGSVDTIAAVTPPLPPGAYRVEWKVLSTDGHVVRGSYSFRLGR